MIMLEQMIILFIVMMVGLLSNKMDIIKGEANKKITALVVNITNPCFILSSVLGDTAPINSKDLIHMACVSVTMFAVLILVATVVPTIFRVPKSSYGVYRGMLVFNNLGFMGAPIVSGMYGPEAVLFVAMFILPFNVLIYTYGILVIKDNDNSEKFSFKNVLNSGVIASILAILIYVVNINVPYVISSSIKLIGNITAPMSMMVIGASFAAIDFKKMLRNYKLLIFCFLKLIVIPIAGICIIKMFISNEELLGISLVMLATPVGSMVPMLATTYGGDVELGSVGVALTTVLSVVTLPLLFVIFGF